MKSLIIYDFQNREKLDLIEEQSSAGESRGSCELSYKCLSYAPFSVWNLANHPKPLEVGLFINWIDGCVFLIMPLGKYLRHKNTILNSD